MFFNLFLVFPNVPAPGMACVGEDRKLWQHNSVGEDNNFKYNLFVSQVAFIDEAPDDGESIIKWTGIRFTPNDSIG